MVAQIATKVPIRTLLPTLAPKSPLLRNIPPRPVVAASTNHNFSTTKPSLAAQNRIYDSVRDPATLHSLLLLSSNSRTPLITLWKTSWCRSCTSIAPLIHSLISSGAVPSTHDGGAGRSVGYVEVELDAPDMGEMGMRYGISSVPTLLAFDRQEAQVLTRVTDVGRLKDEAFLREWIEAEAARGGDGGAGGSLLGALKGVFGGGS